MSSGERRVPRRTSCDQKVVELEAAELRLHLRSSDRNARVAVRKIVGELPGEVRRADRHHHGVGPQDRVQRDHKMRAVLQVDEHAVARPHAAFALEIAGERFDPCKGFAISQRLALEMKQRLFRHAPRRFLERRVQRRGRRRGQAAIQSLMPR